MSLQRATRTHRMKDAHYVCCVYMTRVCMCICIYVRSVYGIGNMKIVDRLLNYTSKPGRIRAHYYDTNRSFRIYAHILCYFESSNSKLSRLISTIQEVELFRAALFLPSPTSYLFTLRCCPAVKPVSKRTKNGGAMRYHYATTERRRAKRMNS